jgi:hypothetical protein
MKIIGLSNSLFLLIILILFNGNCTSKSKINSKDMRALFYDDSTLMLLIPKLMFDTCLYIEHDICCMDEYRINLFGDTCNKNYLSIRFDPYSNDMAEFFSKRGVVPPFDKSKNLIHMKFNTLADSPGYNYISSDTGQNGNTPYVIANFRNSKNDTTWITHFRTFDKIKARNYDIYFHYDQSPLGLSIKKKLPEITAQIKIRD